MVSAGENEVVCAGCSGSSPSGSMRQQYIVMPPRSIFEKRSPKNRNPASLTNTAAKFGKSVASATKVKRPVPDGEAAREEQAGKNEAVDLCDWARRG
jgi:hypothetical protein